MWRVIASLVMKELLLLWRDRRSRLALILPPLLQLFLFSYAATFDVTNTALVIHNRDSGEASRELVSRFAGAPLFREVRMVYSEAALRAALDAQETLAAVSIDGRFSADLLAGRSAHLQILLDGRRSNSAQIVHGYLNSMINQFAAERGVALLPQVGAPALVTRHWFNPSLESLWIVVPALVGILTMMIVLVIGAISLARERELGTLEQLLVTPLTPWQIMLGKLLPAVIVGMIEGLVVVLMAMLWFRVPLLGNILWLYLGMVLFIWSVVGVGIFISTMTRTQQQALVGVLLFMVPCATLSGVFTPLENMPEWVQTLTYVNPLRYFSQVTKAVFLQEAGLALLWPQFWPMLLIGVLTFGVAVFNFRRRLY